MVPPLLAPSGIEKRCGGANVTRATGEIHVLLGQNSAGKSRLTGIISGATRPDRGRMTLAGAGVKFTPRDAHGAGKETVMLKGIDRVISAELLMVLMSMGHGDDLLICDVNHPASTIAKCTTHGRLVHMEGCELPRAAEAILSLMPLDTFVPCPVVRMKVVNDPDRIMPVQARVQAVVDRAEGRAIRMEALERFDFYAAARLAYAVVRTSDPGPYGCFILRKGVI